MDDIRYFQGKLIQAIRKKDLKKITLYKKRLELILDAVVIYRIGRIPNKHFYNL